MAILIYIGIAIALLYGVLWLLSIKTYKVAYGISFNQNHAESLGLNWQEAYEAMLSDLRPKSVRIAAMWSDVEQESGTFDFSRVDWMMDKAAEHGARVLLVVGQKAPRWPECHVPEWVRGYEEEEARTYLLRYVRETVMRYKAHSALELWQVENEPFIRFEFGDCSGYDEGAVYKEIALVRELDPDHGVVITDSGELSTWRRASRAGDIFATTLYRVVQTPGGMTWTHGWLPAGLYKMKARLWGRGYDDFFISELQAEPWFTDATPLDTPVKEQEKTMDPKRLAAHFAYAERVGASRAYLWGVEWWYFMKTVHGDARYWELVKEKVKTR